MLTDAETYIISRWLYSIGKQPLISDDEYNALHLLLIEQEVLMDYTKRTWSEDPCPVDLLKKYNMEWAIEEVQILDKSSSMPSLRSDGEVFDAYRNKKSLYYLSYKLNGWNIVIHYYNQELINLHTRARDSDGMDVTGYKQYIPNKISRFGRVKVIGELYLTEEDFEELKKRLPDRNLKEIRASVASAISIGAFDLLHFTVHTIMLDRANIDYELLLRELELDGFDVVKLIYAYDAESILQAVEMLSSQRERNIPSDGVVIRDSVTGISNAARIKAWKEPIYQSYVLTYEQEYSTQEISLQLHIYPVVTAIGTQRKIPITNPNRAISLDLEPGCPIAFKLNSQSNSVIEPYTTKLLQTKYKSNYEMYRTMIELTEMNR